MRATFLLLKDIQAKLQKAFAEFFFDNSKEKGNPRPPHIWIGHAPPKQSKPTEFANTDKMPSGDPPFIIVRLLEDEDKEDKSALVDEAKIGILCCIYNEESYKNIEAAYNDIFNMSDRVKLTLVSNTYWENNHWWRDDKIKRVFGLQKELGSIYDVGAQDHPIYGAAVLATFKAAALPRPSLIEITHTKENQNV